VFSRWLNTHGARPSPQAHRLDKTVSVVLTSCGRPDLLIRTLESFFQFNTYTISQLIVVEDGASVLEALSTYPIPCAHELICTGERVGQIAAIDYAYSRLESEYIFHLEDDWEFYAPNFIEKSMVILERHPECLQVYLRALDDTNKHPVDRRIHKDDGVIWRRMRYGFRAYGGEWNGFSFNPGLRRLTDYVAVGGYGIHALTASAEHAAAESALSRLYRKRNMFAAILSDRGGGGYVRHTGWQRTVSEATRDFDVSQG
jgi:Glycosyl transferase family 2